MRVGKMLTVVGCVIGACSASSARASILLSDSFTYPDGPLISATNSPWTTLSGNTPGQVDVASDRVNITGAETEDVVASLSSPISSGTVYAGLSFQLTALPTGTTYFALLTDVGSLYRGRVHTTTTGAATGSYRIGIGDTTSTIVTVPVDLSLNTDYRFVVANDTTAGRSTLYLNPTTETGGTVATDTTTAVTLSRFGLRQATGEGTIVVDDLVVATTFAEAATVPEPASLAALGLGAIGLLRRARRPQTH